MDVSTFFLSWKRLWLWVVTPLLFRLLVTFSSAYLARPSEEELSRTKVYVDAVARMEVMEKAQALMLEPFMTKSTIPFQEIFLTEVSRNGKRADVRVNTDCSNADVMGTQLQRSRFTVTGSAASLHEMTLFLDYMMQQPSAVLVDLSVQSHAASESADGIEFRVVFEHVAIKAAPGKVS